MFKMQSKNVTTLCSELGFSEEFPDRDPKAFQKSIADFRNTYVALGNPLPPTRPDSLEAQRFALAFCIENDRGETLWPSNTLHKRLRWSTDRPQILKNLAHIFALQAFYKYQRNLKAEKKDMSNAADTSPAPPDERELSPESSKYVTNLPSGTRRRPAKGGSPGAQSDAEKARILAASIEEVVALDPRNDDKPAIKEFTTQWLAKNNGRWPTSADVRLKTLMHIHDFYDADDPAFSILKVLVPLRKGTEIEECDIGQYKEFQARIRERVSFHVKDLWASNFIQYESGNKVQKNPIFREVWKNRDTYWAPKELEAKRPSTEKVPDIYDIPDDDSTVSRPPKNRRAEDMPPPPRPMSSFFTRYAPSTSSKSPIRRKADDSIQQDNMTHQQKKQKTDGGNTSNYTNSPYSNSTSTASAAKSFGSSANRASTLTLNADRISSTNFGRSASNIAEETSTIDTEMTSAPGYDKSAQPRQPPQEPFTDQNLQETIRMHQAFLADDDEEETSSPTKTTAARPQTPKSSRPMTPKSPVEVPAISEQAPKVEKVNTSAPLPRSSLSPQPKIKTELLLSPIRDSRRSLAPSPQPSRQRLLLFIQGADRKWDFDNENSLSSAHLKNSSVTEFFALYSQKSRVLLESLTCLTFTFVFAEGEEMVVHREDEAEWERLKDLAMALFPLYRKRKPSETKFRVTAEIGDKTSKMEDLDEYDSWGF